MIFEKRFIYFPMRYPQGDWDAPAASAREPGAIPVQDVWLVAEDGVRLHGWHATPSGNPQAPTVLAFHGNAGNVSGRYHVFCRNARLGLSTFMIDYRGYGRSDGRPHEKGLYRDADAAWSWLTGRPESPPDRVVLHGTSLGGAVAVELATRIKPAGLVLESAFTSIADMARLVMPIVPAWMLRTRMDVETKIRRTRGLPKLLIHGKADQTVPFAHGQRLFAAAPGPCQRLWLPDADHNDVHDADPEAYEAALGDFVQACVT